MRRYAWSLVGAVAIAVVPLLALTPRSVPAAAVIALQFVLMLVGIAVIVAVLVPRNRLPYRNANLRSEQTVRFTRVVGQTTGVAADWIAARRNFQGRDREIERILAFHRKAQQPDNAPFEQAGPLLIPIHGKPGVGKTALAQELARRLAGDYADGQYYANLGNAGDARSPGEILKVLLGALAWTDPLPEETWERAKIFRALNVGKRRLFILDAARDPNQILDILPSEPRCTVIVTSRRDIGPRLGGRSWHLATPEIDGALDHLHSVAGLPAFQSPECAVELVDLCGRLPLAIQAAGEWIAFGGDVDVCRVRDELRDEDSRIEQLSRRGRDLEEAIATEFERLSAGEQLALCLLSLVESPTFAPRALCPLQLVSLPRAESTMTSLCSAQLLDSTRQDVLSGLARYHFGPLVRLFVRDRITQDAELAAQCGEARQRLWSDYLERVAKLPEDTWQTAAAGQRQTSWVRSDYRDLMRSALVAHDEQDWTTCWRIVAWLGECLPHGPLDELEHVFRCGLEAAGNDGGSIARVDVLLAYAGVLTALERYPAANEQLQEAARCLDRSDADPGLVALRRALIDMRYGEGYLQMRLPRRAAETLSKARAQFERLDAHSEARLARVLEELNSEAEPAEPSVGDTVLDGQQFWSLIAVSEHCRRSSEWQEAEGFLREAATRFSDDARRTANVQYRRARLALEQALHLRGADGPVDEVDDLLIVALRRSTQALLSFQNMGNRIGVLRARCMSVRAMAAAGELASAAAQLDLARQELAGLDRAEAGEALEPLRARYALAEGILLLQQQASAGDAHRRLREAARAFDQLHDMRNSGLAVDLAGQHAGQQP